MLSGTNILERIGAILMPRLGLIRQEVSERDREWFARCRIRQFGKTPWLAADGPRGLATLCLLAPASHSIFTATLAALVGLWGLEFVLRKTLTASPANLARLLLQIRCFLILRAIVWTVVTAAVIRLGQPGTGTALLFALATLLFDIPFVIAFPVVGLVGGSLLVSGITAALWAAPGISHVALLAISIMSIAALRFALSNLYYLFATRQLRTRRLATANETIRSLLQQYDEHGADVLVEMDRDGKLVHPSGRLCEVLGRSADELVGASFSALFEAGDERSAMLLALNRQHQFRNLAVPLRIRGERHWWSLSGAAILDADGREEGFRCFAQDVTEQRANEERIRIMAMRDNLTGLVNRAVFTERLADALARSSEQQQCGVLCIDLDSFKLVNDTYGHAAGDSVLIETACRIEALLGRDMLAARLGGDELAVLAWNLRGAEDLARLGQSIIRELSRPIVREDAILPCGASAGMALAPEHGATDETLLRAADLALYEAKARGRGISVMFHPELLAELQDRRSLESDLRLALERQQFEVWYQPLLEIASRRTVGYEALLRWNHPVRGMVEPSIFIPLAEEAGLIGPIGEWVLHQSLTEAATWRDDLTIAVNVSPAQMRGDALLGQVINALAKSGVAPDRLELEITETLLMENGDTHLQTLHRLRALGVRIALDDFGTGYSSLNYLRQFPFDKLKVDRSFVSEIVQEPESRAIVETVLGLARKFDMKTTAEGIESEAQLVKLRCMGCSQAQGFLFDKPLPPAQIPPDHRKAIPLRQSA